MRTQRSEHFGSGDANNTITTTHSRDNGSGLKAGANLQMNAAGSVHGVAADLQAAGTVTIRAQQDVVLAAGTSTTLSISVERGVVRHTRNGDTVSVPGQTLQQYVQAQAGTPALAYLQQLQGRSDVRWSEVELAYKDWNYDQQGLTQAGAALVSIAVMACTGGAGAGLLGGTAGATAGATTTLGAMANAGFASLMAQATVAMVNNGGDIGKTLTQLGSEQSIKSLLASMLTAGVMDKLGGAAGFNQLAGQPVLSNIGGHLTKNITTAVVSTGVGAIIEGKPLDGDALVQAVGQGVITTGMAAGAQAIGDAKPQLGPVGHKLAHGALGCAGGAAMAGNASGCAPGAAGAIVGELAAERYNPDNSKSDEKTLNVARTASAVAGLLVGGGGENAAAVNTGTVFDSIKATQPTYPGSAIPRSFEMTLPNGQSVWVAGNATEHMAEFAQMKAISFPPEAVRLASQQQLASLQGAVNTAIQNGVAYNQILNVGGWELKFAPPRQPGQLPSLIHALQKH